MDESLLDWVVKCSLEAIDLDSGKRFVGKSRVQVRVVMVIRKENDRGRFLQLSVVGDCGRESFVVFLEGSHSYGWKDIVAAIRVLLPVLKLLKATFGWCLEDEHFDVKAVGEGKATLMLFRTTPEFSRVIIGLGVNRGIHTVYEDLGRFKEDWNKAVIVTRFDASMQWGECERLMAIFLKKWRKPILRPLETFSAVAVMESREEVDLLVKDGSLWSPERRLFSW